MKAKELIKINYENSKKIHKEYDGLVTDIIAYVKAELTEDDGEEAVNDILEILLGAQERGEDLNVVVGDYKEFCTQVIASYKEGSKYYFLKNIKEIAKIGAGMVFFFLALDIFCNLADAKTLSVEKLTHLSYRLSLVPIIDTFATTFVAGLSLKVIAKMDDSSKRKGIFKDKVFYVLWGIYILLIGSMVISRLVLKKVVIVEIPNLLLVLVLAVIVFAVYIFLGIKTFRSIK